jgi:hypothetical protein
MGSDSDKIEALIASCGCYQLTHPEPQAGLTGEDLSCQSKPGTARRDYSFLKYADINERRMNKDHKWSEKMTLVSSNN